MNESVAISATNIGVSKKIPTGLARPSILFVLSFMILFLVSLAWYNQVDTSLTQDDIRVIPKYLEEPSFLSSDRTFEQEIKIIADVQKSVLNVSPLRDHDPGIPFGHTREPQDLYEVKHGLCSDRSRVIEKVLKYYGFKTRHISAYFINKKTSPLKALTTRRSPSHAVSEVLTSKGWLVITPNHAWLPIDDQNNPVSIKQIQAATENGTPINWAFPKPPDAIYFARFVYIYGLYSRHGQFYPPYNAIPDINYKEFMDNFF